MGEKERGGGRSKEACTLALSLSLPRLTPPPRAGSKGRRSSRSSSSPARTAQETERTQHHFLVVSLVDREVEVASDVWVDVWPAPLQKAASASPYSPSDSSSAAAAAGDVGAKVGGSGRSEEARPSSAAKEYETAVRPGAPLPVK